MDHKDMEKQTQWKGRVRKMAQEDFELDLGIIIMYEDDAKIHAVMSLPQEASIQLLTLP